MHHNFITVLKRKSGIAIMSVMLFFVVMTLFLGALSFTAVGNARVSGTNSQSMAAFYAAEAGTSFVTSDFKSTINVASGTMTQTQFESSLNNFITRNNGRQIVLSSNEGKPVIANISFRNNQLNSVLRTFSFVIVSEGRIGTQSRVLETRVDLTYSVGAGNQQGFPVKHAILVKNTLNTQNNFTITVSPAHLVANPSAKAYVGTLSLTQGAINFGNPSNFSGTVELRSNANLNVANVAASQIERTLSITEFSSLDFSSVRADAQQVLDRPNNRLPSITNFTTSDFNIDPSTSGTFNLPAGSFYVPTIRFSTNRNITINANGNVFIVTDSMHMQGNVLFTGTGQVRFYVRRNMSMIRGDRNTPPTPPTFMIREGVTGTQGSTTANIGRQTDMHLFQVFVDETNIILNITPANNNNIHGSFMFNNANIDFSNNISFGGYIMTGGNTVNLSNGAQVYTALYYAPNATVNIGNSTVRGAVIADRVVMANNARFEYDPAFETNFPFAVTSPIVQNLPPDRVQIISPTIHQTIER